MKSKIATVAFAMAMLPAFASTAMAGGCMTSAPTAQSTTSSSPVQTAQVSTPIR